MTDPVPARSFSLRHALFWLALILFALSLLIPTPSGSAGANTLGGSALAIYTLAIGWSTAASVAANALTFAQSTLLALALYSNVAFIIMPYMLRVASVTVVTKAFLLVLLALDASVGIFVPAIAQLPAFWVWWASIASLVIAFVVFPGEGIKAGRNDGTVGRGELSPFVWVLLGFTLFWIAVSAGNYAAPPEDAVTAAANAPLTAYVTDRAKLLTADEASRLDFALQGFAAKTPNQIAVAIYPRAPTGSIEEMTVRIAERSRLGAQGLDTGAVLFVFVAERAARLEVGYGLEGMLTDADSRRILEGTLTPAFARNAYGEGLDATLNTIFAKLQDAYQRDGPPGDFATWSRALKDDRPNRLGRLWNALRGVGLLARIGIAFLGAFVGLVLWSTLPQWARLARDLARGVGNLAAKRPFQQGLESVDGATLWDSLRLAFWTLGVLIPAGAVILVAGGGAFGGAGALVHW